MNKNILETVFYIGVLSCSLSSQLVRAGFLDMPEITEPPDLERKSMLRDMDIPELRYRNPDPEAGPRLAVSEFRIQGLVEYPELGITREVVNKLVDEIRHDLMQEGKLLPSGYSLDELGELSDLLVDIEDQTQERHVTPIEVQKLVWLIRDQRQKRGITLGQIESIAEKITRFYRERGFVLAKAYIPKQEVREGIVTLTLLLGMLGDVGVSGNSIYKAETISSAFNSLLTLPVKNDLIEERLYLVNDMPGLVVDGFFEPGYQVGDTKLTINVKNEQKYAYNIRVDNHGSEETGLYRLYADMQMHNLFDWPDDLQLSLLQASSPSNTSYWKIEYTTMLFHPRWYFSVGNSLNQFVVDQSQASDLELSGDVNLVESSISYKIKRGRTSNHELKLRFEDIETDLSLGNLTALGSSLDESVRNISLVYDFDILQEASRRLHQGSVKLTDGEVLLGANTNQDVNYSILNLDYTLLGFYKVPFFDTESRMIFRTALQYSGTNLSSILRSALSGANRARSYAPNVFTADDAIYLGADWIFNSPDLFDFNIYGDINFKQLARPFVFVDYAWGNQYSLVVAEPDTTGELVGAGIGLKLSHGKKFQGALQIAVPVSHSFSDANVKVSDESSRLVFDFQYSF